MKNVFKLIVLSAVRIFFKAKVLIVQLLVLVLLAVSILGTISLSNITLEKSYDSIAKNGNMADLDINNAPINENVSYDVNGVPLSERDAWSTTAPSTKTIDVFNPLVSSVVYQAKVNGGTATNPTFSQPVAKSITGFLVTPGAGAGHLITGKNGNYLSVIASNPNSSQWLPDAQDVFSLYQNVLPVGTDGVPYTQANLFSPSIYTTNPFSFLYNQNGQLDGVSALGVARLINPNGGYYDTNQIFSLAHGVLDARTGLVAGTTNSLNWLNPIPSGLVPIDAITLNILASPSEFSTADVLYTPGNWGSEMPQQLSLFYSQFCNPGQNSSQFTPVLDALNQVVQKLNAPQTQVQVPYYTFTYNLVPNQNLNEAASGNETANSAVNFIYSKLFQNGKILPQYAQDLQYFQGKIQIPLIPNYTTLATNFSQPNPQMNVASVANILQNVLQTLAKQLTTTVIPNLFATDPVLQTEYNNDFSLDQELSKLGLSYDESANVDLDNPINGNKYIVARANLPTNSEPNPVNKIVLNAGMNLLPPEISEANSPIENIPVLFRVEFDAISDGTSPAVIQNIWNIWQEYDFTALFQMMEQANWQTKSSVVIEAEEMMQPLTKAPSSFQEWYTNIWPQFRKFCSYFKFANASWTGYGFAIQAEQEVPISKGSVFIPFTINVVDPTAYLAVLSSNFMRANANSKSVLPANIVEQALELPFEDLSLTTAQVNSDPAEYVNHFVLDPITHKLVYYQDFLSWLAKLSDRYKVTVDSQQYIIVGAGLSPDFMYPALTNSNLLLNSRTSGVVYTNSAGFARSTDGVGATINHYISIRWPTVLKYDLVKQQKLIDALEAFTTKIYGENEVYKITDPKQPNQLLYVRMNFSYDLRNVVLLITVIVGIIIAILSLFFISTLLRSIIKQNRNILGIVNANGVPKNILAVAFFPFALLPAVICGTIGYLIAYFLTPSLTGMIISYWAPNITRLDCQWWLFIVVPLVVLVILFSLLMAVIMWTIRKKTTELLTESSEFRMNWLIMHIGKLTRYFGALGSFRLTYVMGNITRFFVLTAIVTAFITVSGVFVGTIGTFQNALNYTIRNHQYTYAFNLYSPTAEGGYYSEIPMSQVGTTQQGLQPLYDVNTNTGFYGKNYVASLQDPYDSNLYYTSLFLPSTSVASQIQGNVQFFKNKIFTKIDLDVNLNFVGADINPWNFAHSFAPAPVIALSNFDMQSLLNNAFKFFYWVQQNDLYQTYSPTTFNQPWTINGSPINPSDPNTKEWIYLQKMNSNGEEEWYLNPLSIGGAPTFEFYPHVVQLFIDLINITHNPLYQEWAMKQFGVVKNYNYLLGDSVVATQPGDGTYTYLDSLITSLNGKPLSKSLNVQIDGIKPQTNYILLYNNQNQIMNRILADKPGTFNGQPVYPLVINEVVARKYGFKVGDILGTETSNQLNRFILKYNDPTGNNDVASYFKVVAITTSRSEQTYYTSQADANTILGYQNPHWADAPNYVPFNGLFTRSQTPSMIYQFGSVYSPSGLSPAIGIWSDHASAGMAYQLFRSWNRLNKILMFNATNGLHNYSQADAGILLGRLIKTFGMATPIVVSIQTVQTQLTTITMGQLMDQTVKNVMTFVTSALIPTLIIIIVMLGSMIVVEARRLIALLKVLGYGNWSNTFSFLFVYLIVLFLGLGISIGLIYLILFALSAISFGIFNIIITPVAPWWIYVATFGAVALIFVAIYLVTYFQLRKINPAMEIAVR